MKKILIFSQSLDGGGAEAAITQIVKHLDKSRFEVSVVSETDNERYTDEIKQNSTYRSFIKKNTSGSFLREIINRIILKLYVTLPPKIVKRTYLKGKYDIEVAACEGLSTKIIASSQNKSSKKIAYVHTDFINNPWSVSVYNNDEKAEKSCYEKFDKIICVSQTIKDSFVKKYGMEEKIEVMYNIVDDEKIRRLSMEKSDFTAPQRPLFVLVGNFLPVKGYNRFVKAAAKLRDEGYDFSALIIGKDYQKEETEQLIKELDLQSTITLMDFKTNPFCYMKQADAFVCSSLAEGFSTAVSEAVILSLPVITTDCSGMSEIFGGLECGIICKNSEGGLYEALKKVLDKPDLLEEYKINSAKRSNFFSLEKRCDAVNAFYKSL